MIPGVIILSKHADIWIDKQQWNPHTDNIRNDIYDWYVRMRTQYKVREHETNRSDEIE